MGHSAQCPASTAEIHILMLFFRVSYFFPTRVRSHQAGKKQAKWVKPMLGWENADPLSWTLISFDNEEQRSERALLGSPPVSLHYQLSSLTLGKACWTHTCMERIFNRAYLKPTNMRAVALSSWTPMNLTQDFTRAQTLCSLSGMHHPKYMCALLLICLQKWACFSQAISFVQLLFLYLNPSLSVGA